MGKIDVIPNRIRVEAEGLVSIPLMGKIGGHPGCELAADHVSIPLMGKIAWSRDLNHYF